MIVIFYDAHGCVRSFARLLVSLLVVCGGEEQKRRERSESGGGAWCGVVWCGGGERSKSGEKGAKAEMVHECANHGPNRFTK